MSERRRRYKVTATVRSIKGRCGFGHKVGDVYEVSMNNCGGVCGLFYHDIFPWIVALQTGGEVPWVPKDSIEP